MPRLTETEVATAMAKLSPELHRLLAWLVSGQHYAGSQRNGTT